MDKTAYIEKLLAAIQDVAAGKFDVNPGRCNSSEELDAVGVGIRMLSEEIRAMQADLKSQNQELEKKEKEFRKEKEKYEEVIDRMTSAIAVYKVLDGGKEFVFENFNRFAEKLDGVKKKDIYGKPVQEVFPAAEEIGIVDALKRVYLTGKPEDLPTRLYSDDRLSGWRQSYIFKLSTDEVAAVYTDETEKMQFLEELKSSNDRFSVAVKGSSDGIWDWDLKTNALFLSAQWKAQLGYADEELPNEFSEFERRIHPHDKERVLAYVNDYLQGKFRDYHIEFRMEHKDGSYRWIMARGEALRDEAGMPYRMAGSHTDITDRKLQERQLKQLNKTKDKLFSIISHDLKNPFQSILGLTDLLLTEKELLTEDQQESLEMIKAAGLNAFELLDNLLDWSRMQTGKLEVHPNHIPVLELVNREVQLISPSARKKNIQIQVDIPEEYRVYADRQMISTVLRNLLTNALKFTPSGKRIEVLATRETHQQEIHISVKDEGMGIAKERMDTLFEIEKNKSTPGTEDEKGTGLGLVLCKEFTEQNKGRISVESTEGDGSIFVVSLPEKEL